MSHAITQSFFVVPRIRGAAHRASDPVSRAGGLWSRLARAISKPRSPLDGEYERIIEASGGKLTDSLEREAERRLLGRHYL